MNFETFDQSDEGTLPDQQKDNDKDKCKDKYTDKDSDKDKLLTFDIFDTDYNYDKWEPWIHHNLCYLTIKSDTG